MAVNCYFFPFAYGLEGQEIQAREPYNSTNDDLDYNYTQVCTFNRWMIDVYSIQCSIVIYQAEISRQEYTEVMNERRK